MTRRPGDDTPDPPGGRAAERLREFLDQRFPGEVSLPPGASEEVGPPAEAADADCRTEQVEDFDAPEGDEQRTS